MDVFGLKLDKNIFHKKVKLFRQFDFFFLIWYNLYKRRKENESKINYK